MGAEEKGGETMFYPAKRQYYFFSKQFWFFAAAALMLQLVVAATALYRGASVSKAFGLVPFLIIALVLLVLRLPKGFRLRNGEIVFPKRFHGNGAVYARIGGFRFSLRKRLAVIYGMEEIRISRTAADLRRDTAKISFVGKIRAEKKNGEPADDVRLPVDMVVNGGEIYGVENAEAVIEELKRQFPRAVFIEE